MIRSMLQLMLALLVFSLTAHAAEIRLKNGDRISGKVVEETESEIILETEYAGRIAIAKQHVENIAERSPRASGPNAANDLPPAVPEGPQAEETLRSKPTAVPAPVPAKTRLFSGGFMGWANGWEGSANAGFSFTSGNSNNTTMTTGLRAVKHGSGDNLTVYLRSLWNNTQRNGRRETTQNAFWGGARYDRNVDRGMFGFVSYDFESDKPKKLHFRSVVGSGLGHHTVKRERTEVDLLAGGAWNRTWQRGTDTDTPEALAGMTVKHRFNDRVRVQNAFTWFQNATDIAEYRYIFDATLSIDVTKRIGVYFSAGDRFNNDPLGTAQKNDFLFTTGMKWSFGKKK